MVAIGSEGQLHHAFFVPMERRYFLVRSDVPNRNPPIASSGGEPATVRGKREAVKFTGSRTKFERVLVASLDIPKANFPGGGRKWLIIRPQRPTFHPASASGSSGGSVV